MTIIYFLLLLSVIITIHEAGHLLAAKKFNVYCYEFSFGMGPLLWQKKTKETKYSVRAIPIGGYVSMAGETDADELYPDVKVPDERRLINRPWWQRIIILLAGVTMNFLLAWLIFSIVYLSQGVYTESPPAVVGSVRENSPAERAGFEPGDIILEIRKDDGDSVRPKTFMDMQTFYIDDTEVATYVIERNGQQLELQVTPEFNEEQQTYLIGITSGDVVVKEVNLINCWYYGAREMKDITSLMIRTITNLFRGIGLNQLSGPVGIYQATETYASFGLLSLLFLMAQLSLNVGIFNLLPLPVLDGGQVVITLAEVITGKKMNEKVKIGLFLVCWIALISLMLFATWNDIARIFGS
ncbi:MAG: RIP metalloprotease RseP [Erysipelotrichaceae bacterium]|nr:RIP metalloprotease RseP [Erysipelotrichaceae bacterium]